MSWSLVNLLIFLKIDTSVARMNCANLSPATTQSSSTFGTSNNEYICHPPDFTMTQYSHGNLNNPRTMDHIIYNDNLIVYIGSLFTQVTAVVDIGNTGTFDTTVIVYQDGSHEFNVVTIDPVTNYLYIASQTIMLRCDNMHAYALYLATGQGNVINDGGCVLFMTFPINSNDATHARHYAAFNYPTYNDLCIAFGADCDNCLNNAEPRTSILCFDMSIIRTKYSTNDFPLDTNMPEARYVAYGVRNSVGFDWHPVTHDFWFTDNGANDIFNANPSWSSTSPDDELNVITTEGEHFGYPYEHCEGAGSIFLRDLNDASNSFNDYQHYSSKPGGLTLTLPKQPLGPHVAALGIKFYNRNKLIEDNCLLGKKPKLFPAEYTNTAFIALHGSWAGGYNVVTGYKVTTINIDTNTNNIIDYKNFLIGFNTESSTNNGQSPWARPAFVHILDDGSLLITDDYQNLVFRVQYNGVDADTYDCPTMAPTINPTKTPTITPSDTPTKMPTKYPTKTPSDSPSRMPSKMPTKYPTRMPSKTPTNNPAVQLNPPESPTQVPAGIDSVDNTNANGMNYIVLVSVVVSFLVAMVALT